MRHSLLLLVTFVVSLAITGACKLPPSVNIVPNGAAVIVDVQSFGEYGTEIHRIRLTDNTDKKVVWEVVAQRNVHPSLHTFTLRVGANPVANWRDAYEIITPNTEDFFTLNTGRQYLLEAWSGDTEWTRSHELFQFGSP